MTQLLHRLGYVYKKPKLIPGKASAEQQKDFVECYQTLKAKMAPDDPIYFMDATHLQHNPVAGYKWIKRGQDHEIPGNTGRQRININGAIDCAGLCPIIRHDLLGGIQLLCIGIIGEYLSKIYMETKRRPHFFIEERTGATGINESK